MSGKYKTYSPEFREEAARMVVETSRAIADVARELGISETSLGNWVRAYRERHAEDEPPLQMSERARLRELERKNRELEMENTFLKKAAAYFAREQRRRHPIVIPPLLDMAGRRYHALGRLRTSILR
jgi:transposase-like protein